MFWLLAAALTLTPPKAKAPAPPAVPPAFLYTARRDRNMEVVVDVNADRSQPGVATLVVFFLYARPVDGSDMLVENYAFDCGKDMVEVLQSGKESRWVEPLALKDTPSAPFPTPRPSLLGTIADVACKGASAIPAVWTPNTLNLRQISRAYYEDYLGQVPG